MRDKAALGKYILINASLTCRDRNARFNNNRDIAMIRTGKTRSADVDILIGPRAKDNDEQRKRSASIHCAPTISTTMESTNSPSDGTVAIYKMRCLFSGWTVLIGYSTLPVSGFHSYRLEPRSTRDLIFQLPTTFVCRALRFSSLSSIRLGQLF